MEHVEDWIQGGRSHETERHRRALLRNFSSFAKQTIPTILEKAHESPFYAEDLIKAYIGQRTKSRQNGGAGLSENSAKGEFNALSAFFRANRVLVIAKIDKKYKIFGPRYVDTDFVVKQEGVKRMVKSARKLLWKTVIAFLAQTGQRQGVLRALKNSMIERKDGYGIVKVGPKLLDWKGTNVNKVPTRYKFIIGRQSLKLIDKLISAKNLGKDDWIFHISSTQITRLVENSADRAGVQVLTPKDDGGTYQVRPHHFRTYWKSQMKQRGAEGSMLSYMMNNRPKPYDRPYEEKLLLSAYKKAEPLLRVY